MTFLLDVNVLIALVDPVHVRHDAAHDWFEREGGRSWATCPVTENGVVRIVGNARYPNSPGSPASAAQVFAGVRRHAGHVFWPDGISLFDPALIRLERLLTHAQVTDSYLLALAVAHGGRLATFDRRMTVSAVVAGESGVALIA